MKLEQRILDLLGKAPGKKAAELARELGVQRREINRLLHGSLKGRVRRDDRYRWYLAAGRRAGGDAARSRGTRYPDTPLSRLARYYLACLGLDESGVSVFAASNSGPLDYAELKEFPRTGEGEELERAIARLTERWRTGSSRPAVYLGFPCLMRFVRSQRSSWSGFFVEPIVLFPVDQERLRSPRADLASPIINHTALGHLTGANREALMEEVVRLEEDLGLADVDDVPDPEDFFAALRGARPEWTWVEDCQLENLRETPPLREIQGEDRQGIYNRAVVVVTEKPPYTRGLESELSDLAKLSPEEYKETALGCWLSGEFPSTAGSDAPVPLEVIPLNAEQRDAVRRGLSRPLTVITGPPGTGKSQVVTNLLVNAAWHGQRVLFASKNNKAVDVVESRVNNLGPRPILLRLGANEYRTRLAEYLLGLLSVTCTGEDEQEFEELKNIHERYKQQVRDLEVLQEQKIELRNRVDKLEQDAESARKVLPPGAWNELRQGTADLESIRQALDAFCGVLDRADRNVQSTPVRIAWPLLRRRRFRDLEAALGEVGAAAEWLGCPPPGTGFSDTEVRGWREWLEQLEGRLGLARKAEAYFRALRGLVEGPRLEGISRALMELAEKMAANAGKLWQVWLRLQPSRLGAEDRKLIGNYVSLLKMVIEAGQEGALPRNIARKYREVSFRMAHLFSCWAVTSLSARGRIPFKPGYFDVVVIDEASQCDIASAIPLLYRAKRAVIIGDPKQLSHISGLRRGQDQQLLEKHGLVESHAAWAYSYNSLFDLAASTASGDDVVALRDHYRSHADIVRFSNRYFYEDRLRVATRYEKLRFPAGGKGGVRWVDVRGRVERPPGGGAVNRAEAEAVVKELRRLVLERGYRGTVGVVSPFRAQANLIRSLVGRDPELQRALNGAEFLVDTVHRFQGDERDVMIFSPVVAENMPRGALGFLQSNGNLFNVAITRARALLLVVGDRSGIGECPIEYLREFARYVGQLERQEERQRELREEDLGPDYPEVANPEQVSEWEKVLYRALYRAGMRVIPQYVVEKYILDFALFDGDRRLDIEVDGERYHRAWNGELCRRDQIRNQRLFEMGWDVLRFWVYEVRDDLDGCVERVRNWLEAEKEESGEPG